MPNEAPPTTTGTRPPARRGSASAGAGAGRPPRPPRAACPDRACRQDDAPVVLRTTPRPRAVPARGVPSTGTLRPRRVEPAPDPDRTARHTRRTCRTSPEASSTVPAGGRDHEPAVPVDRLRDALERRAVGQAHRDLGPDRRGPGEVVLGQTGGDRVAEDLGPAAVAPLDRAQEGEQDRRRGRPVAPRTRASDVPVSGSSSAVVETFRPTPTTTAVPGALGEDPGQLAAVGGEQVVGPLQRRRGRRSPRRPPRPAPPRSAAAASRGGRPGRRGAAGRRR